ncbi:MAG TPA: DNA replication/repair protein RecF [Chloroflexota bacterium]|nr:DNA replication/repair protein RecF [Chloroflexota bacterium]
MLEPPAHAAAGTVTSGSNRSEGMRVRRLGLVSFRSYSELEAQFPEGPQVIVGPNAAGKTNLIEGLVVLGTGHSHRASLDGELISWGADFARLEADVTADVDSRLELVIARTSAGGGRKKALVNGVARRPAALSAALPVVLFAPEDMLLIVGSPSGRRAAIDTLVAQTVPAAAATMANYSRALTQRNNLLRAIRDGIAAPDELRFWDNVIVDDGSQIVDWRHEQMARLASPLAEAHAEIAPEEPPLELVYLSKETPGPDETTRDALRRRLAETAEKEQWNGQTLIGPHRDDISFVSVGRDLSNFASRGQQRTAILALKLATLAVLRETHGQPPLLLLDDVFSELDPQRRAHLVRRIGELPQAFVTTTTTDDLDPALVAAATVWNVTPGHLERA